MPADEHPTPPVGSVVDLPATSWFDRLISRPRPRWVTVGIGLVLLLLPLSAAYLDGLGAAFFAQGYWRRALLPPTLIIYLLIVAPMLARSDTQVVRAFRPLVLLDDDAFDRLVHEAARLNPIGEAIAFGVGAALGLWTSYLWSLDAAAFWSRLCLLLSAGLLSGLLGWAVYTAVASIRLTGALHRQSLRIDLFDPRPFEPIGRQSLLVALVFVGGFTLGIVFSFESISIVSWSDWLLSWQIWLLNIPMILVPILIFFVNMRDTHRVLAAEKKRQLTAVEQLIRQSCDRLMVRLAVPEDTGSLAADINALLAYKALLEETRTWPYDTAMLRTLFFSVLVPAGAALARVGYETLFK